ncbi:hypothetical protein CL617_05825 [archaeon]|nr:hypothetical protein [archaeon]|tara:strand:- start:12887 stop:13627 length:741 start_codon:yes stop_codon:yes gene_type:complete
MKIPLLTEGESKVYQALIEIGESSVGNILKISGVSHSKIYDILKRLSEKGLVSSINKNGKQYFSPSEPSTLSAIIDDEKNKLNNIEKDMGVVIKILKSRKNISTPTNMLNSFEGIKGMKTILEKILSKLNKNDNVLILGSPKKIGEEAGGYLKDWQKRRVKKNSICKIITNKDAVSWDDKWWSESKKKKITFTKRSNSVSPAYLVITKDSVSTIYFSSKILSFTIESQDIALRYNQFFNELWKISG